MRGHFVGGTRKLNKHWQSGGNGGLGTLIGKIIYSFTGVTIVGVGSIISTTMTADTSNMPMRQNFNCNKIRLYSENMFSGGPTTGDKTYFFNGVYDNQTSNFFDTYTTKFFIRFQTQRRQIALYNNKNLTNLQERNMLCQNIYPIEQNVIDDNPVVRRDPHANTQSINYIGGNTYRGVASNYQNDFDYVFNAQGQQFYADDVRGSITMWTDSQASISDQEDFYESVLPNLRFIMEFYQ